VAMKVGEATHVIQLRIVSSA